MKSALEHFGRYVIMLFNMFRSMEKFSIYWGEIMRDIVANGVSSVPIVLIISTFIGAVSTVQTAYQLEGGNSLFPLSLIGSVVSATAFLEMAPTITALILAGKIGSNIASQIGTMRISEQIDALEVMGLNATSYLILPKIISGLISFPALVVMAAFFMHAGGIVVGSYSDIIGLEDFLTGARKFHNDFYIPFMLIKAVVFGFIVTSLGAYQGYYVKGGAIEVGLASTRAVVYACIFVLVADYILAELLL